MVKGVTMITCKLTKTWSSTMKKGYSKMVEKINFKLHLSQPSVLLSLWKMLTLKCVIYPWNRILHCLDIQLLQIHNMNLFDTWHLGEVKLCTQNDKIHNSLQYYRCIDAFLQRDEHIFKQADQKYAQQMYRKQNHFIISSNRCLWKR